MDWNLIFQFTNISRTHATIVYRNGAFAIVDNNATNGTNINGVAVPAPTVPIADAVSNKQTLTVLQYRQEKKEL